MFLSITNQKFRLELDQWYEKLFAFHFGGIITVPIEHITAVSTTKPEFSWKTLRAPGTGLPGVLMAGTFYTENGREFWYIKRDPNYLVIDLKDEYYKRIVLTLDNHEFWAERISQTISSTSIS
ncbi:hypothetical protein Pse7367_0552 [Thalassoporum mexicanum PCC 7367]|uniref:hypothetical protein n=1 Tax=Thalassoporum mexicanum TaxID=3457544 RepID=UPI00029FA878|nr:hypothetical protein [Pseudanabaena sp. PCC 7367]AFY68858.1 hypothetical protein Pse7367_0552 [Pseudanabaena sp. PCC 7367]